MYNSSKLNRVYYIRIANAIMFFLFISYLYLRKDNVINVIIKQREAGSYSLYFVILFSLLCICLVVLYGITFEFFNKKEDVQLKVGAKDTTTESRQD